MSYYIITEKTGFQNWAGESQVEAFTPSEFIEKDNKFHENVKGVIIPCELSVDEKDKPIHRHLLYGISFVRTLRLEYQKRYPVLFVSFLPFPVIKKQSVLSVLVESVGHDFLRLPCISDKAIDRLKSLNELTSTELRDVQLFSCKPEGIINARVHQLHLITDKISKDPGYTGDTAASDLVRCIEEICFVARKEPADVIDEFKTTFPVIENRNAGDACKYVKVQGEKLIRDMVSKTGISNYNAEKKRPWKLLMLDDELDKNSDIARLMEAKGIDAVFRTNAEGAMRALDRDDRLRGEISLILCDYRLLDKKDGGSFQQKIQGYTFLQQVGERFQSRILSAMVYSGMPRQFLLETFKTYKLRTEIFSKADFGFDNPGALDYLTTRIAELGDANYEAMIAMPLNTPSWEKSLHQWYVFFRSLKDYEQRELEISDYCNRWITDYSLGNNPQTPLIKGAPMPPLHKDPARCPQCGNVILNQKKPLRDITGDLKHFSDILKARRLAQYLYLKMNLWGNSEKHTLEQIHQLIKPEGTGNTELIRKQLRYKIGLKLSEFPLGATIEELNWLHYDRGVEVLNAYNDFRQRIATTEDITAEFIQQWRDIKKLIEKNNFEIRLKIGKLKSEKKDKDENEEGRLLFKKNEYSPYLFDRNDIGLLIRWLSSVVQENNAAGQMKQFMDEYCERLKSIWKW